MPEPMSDDVFDRLTLLERAQWLHDTAQRRHSEALDRHQAALDRHDAMLLRQQQMQADLLVLMGQHQARMDELQHLMQAIKDLLERGKSH